MRFTTDNKEKILNIKLINHVQTTIPRKCLFLLSYLLSPGLNSLLNSFLKINISKEFCIDSQTNSNPKLQYSSMTPKTRTSKRGLLGHQTLVHFSSINLKVLHVIKEIPTAVLQRTCRQQLILPAQTMETKEEDGSHHRRPFCLCVCLFCLMRSISHVFG